MGKDQDLLEACRTGNVIAVEKLLAGRLSAKRGSKHSLSGGALSTLSKSLLSLKSANVNCADGSGETPLHLAALNGHKEIVLMLLECEANPTILDTQDCSPLHLAAWNGHTDICSQLLQAVNGQTLINLQTREGNTALHFAAQHGHTQTLLLLLQNRADPTIRNLEDLSPLDLAAQYDRLDIVKQLITSHPELVVQRSLTITPLHLASRNGHRAVVQFLLDSGFVIDAKTDKGTALHEAANFCKLDVIRLLLERGIDITVKSQTDCTAEDILRSIPSKAAEDALNILKSHIYHQRTPDSDGERGIVDATSIVVPLATSTASETHQLAKTIPAITNTGTPTVPSIVEKKTNLISRRRQIVTWVLPPNPDLSLPPPIPPRQSVRVPDRSDSINESNKSKNDQHATVIPEKINSEIENNAPIQMTSVRNEDVKSENVDLEPAVADAEVSDKKSEPSSKPPTSLDIQKSGTSGPEPVPRSPSHHRQPPTPDCPPPSPGTALQNIHRKIQPMEKRKSRDMETITDLSLTGQDDASPHNVSLASMDTLTPVSEDSGATTNGTQPSKKKPTPLPRKSSISSETRDIIRPPPSSQDSGSHGDGPSQKSEVESYGDPNNLTHGHAGQSMNSDRVHSFRRSSSDSSTTSSTFMEIEDSVVEMRRPLSVGVESSDWEGHAFAGLLRGSVIGPARDVVHQLSASNALWKKRKSTLSTFAPVMEEDKDIDLEKTFRAIDNIQVVKDADCKKSDEEVFVDDEEDWAKINATFAEFGVSIGRESVFIREHEGKFRQFLTSNEKGENKIQSVGEWLTDIGLPQYENTLVANGFDDTDFLGSNILDEQDLIVIGVDNATHRKTILEASAKLPLLQPIDANNVPQTVAEWLGSLQLDYYFDTFMSHKYDSMDRVVKIWELELVTVLDISSIGHRKRILASLGERKVDTSSSPARTRLPSLDSLTEPRSPFEHVDLYRDYTGVRSKVTDNGSNSDRPQETLLEFDPSSPLSPGLGKAIRDSTIHIRAPNLMHYTGTIKQWRHKPETLIKGCCNYTAHYLGSTLVKELNGPMSTQEGITKLKHRLRRKLQKSSEVISKIPSIMLSISFKGVKFIDAVSKKVVCDHEIANIFCACQDGEHLNFFAYITKDRENGKNYCHVFSVRNRELAGEIILTLGEAFEIAYQLALKERAEQDAAEFDKLSTSDDASSLSSSQPCVNTV
ncbi:ankyrin repeat and sterile alpha motif domain-containing protein 1B-like isoform X11 [Biomphalaria glabrata]|uniref:Ankyrin repeat and sterile alpha motif domain-containing protein 1B-like isoform X11 n=1 Tax=Biomphalaria glabrata TaxID=6526 RepID=A0A9W3BPG8_BIOGL|nr:ankyrin repeat and sterile alpha motif domain-containing protein 1B-like isoform X11 [Biomphalaria glabrata]